ncbi:MAG: mechanosensitive ion channel domain-containing protein [Luteolibacter sp.]
MTSGSIFQNAKAEAFRVAGISLLVAGLVSSGFAQDVMPAMETAEIEARIKVLSDSPEADEDSAGALVDFRDALRFRKSAKTATEKTAEFEKKAKSAAGELEKISSRDIDVPEVEVTEGISLEEAISRAEMAEAALKEAQAEAESHSEEGKDRAARLAALPGLIVEAGTGLAALKIPEAPLATDSAIKSAAYQRALAQRELLKKQILMLRAELKYLEATPTLFTAESGFLARKVAALAKNAEVLRKQVERMRLESASDEVTRAKADVKRFADGSAEKEVAQEVLELAERHGGEFGFGKKRKEANAAQVLLESKLNRISNQFSGAKRRVKLLEQVKLEIDPDTGRLLRSQRQMLPAEAVLRAQLKEVVERSARTQIDLLILENRYEELLTKRAPDASQNPELSALWNARLSGLERLIGDHTDYIRVLRTTTTTLRSLAEVSAEFALFVDERLLWIPSTARIGSDEPLVEWNAITRLIKSDPLTRIYGDAREHFLKWIAVGIFLAYLLFRRRTFRKRLKDAGLIAAKKKCTSFLPTFKALIYSLLLAAPIPLVFWLLHSALSGGQEGVALGLRSIAGFLGFVIFIRVLCQSEGLLTDHFRMSQRRVMILRKALNWFIPVMPLFLFLAICLPVDPITSADGRLSFIAVVVILLVFFEQILRPGKRLVHWQGKSSRGFAIAWYLLAILVTLGLIIGAIIGYYASVQEIRIQSIMSLGIVLITLFVASLLYRWILISRRRFAVDQALKRRAAALAERETKEAEPGEKPQNVESLEEVKANAVKVVDVEEQITRLVRAAAIAFIVFGLTGIWRSTVPALSALDRISLWEVVDDSTEAESESALKNPISAVTGGGSSSEKSDAAADRQEDGSEANDQNADGKFISLQDLLVSIIILLLTIVAARNMPGLLELAVFRHLDLKPGSSFAFTTSIRYLLVVVGVVIAFGMIGITWGKVQWIAAAITLGIGFGLQEIFANFVAGLIILFERPIRLGDVVTIAGVDGKVTQIRIRATTIRQFNSRELIVPNKEFITGQLINWTLSDSVLRFEIPIGIAYGSDTELASKLLLQVANENERILDDPEPMVTFDAFGDSALTFTLKAHVGRIEDLVHAKNELHFGVDREFRKAGIEISYPQQDIHIRTLPEKAFEKPEAEESGGEKQNS